MAFWDIFGFSLTGNKSKSSSKKDQLKTFIVDNDSSIDIEIPNGAVFSYTFETLTPSNEIESIKMYRELSQYSDVDLAISEIRNEMFIFDDPARRAVDIDFTQSSTLSDKMKKIIKKEFDAVYSAMDFNNRGIEYFVSWYIDGRLFLYKVIDEQNPKEGIKAVIKIDPLKIRKIREIPQRDEKGLFNLNDIREYYIYSDTFGNDYTKMTMVVKTPAIKGVIIQKDAIAYSDSGLYYNGEVRSYLHKAIIPFNNLKLMEESLLIYRISRAPERRVFYVGTGNLPKNKAEQYVKELMNRFRNKLLYDSRTGTLSDKRNVLSIVEDYWIPRGSDKTTEITTLPGGGNLGITDDITYFLDKFRDSLNVPRSRFDYQSPTFVFGRSPEISRDEYRFKKFINHLRNRFSVIFEDLLKTELILKNVISLDDWEQIKKDIVWVYAEDNYFVEYKDAEVINSRVSLLSSLEQYVGSYFSRAWVMKNILKFTNSEIEQMLNEIESEKENNEMSNVINDNEINDEQNNNEGYDVENEITRYENNEN